MFVTCQHTQIWDFPGQIDFFDPAFDSEMIFGSCNALVFVIDAQVNVQSLRTVFVVVFLVLRVKSTECSHDFCCGWQLVLGCLACIYQYSTDQ